MKRYIKSSSISKEMSRYYHCYADTGNGYTIKASGSADNGDLKLQIGRAASNGRKTYAFAHFGYKSPHLAEIWYQGKVVRSLEVEAFDETMQTPDEYLDDVAYEIVLLLDKVNEELE